ncbi:uncharacterized protein PFL1_00440 [Pseudozyma flocculosa PF-1]|uniref:Uncharacterized protein n=1 Tax=Pseudozyma flocculosa TaxID=84751 RepID=A0A5C3ETG6_9BASI|nr:uncharacterized protein PFL1_00440 [Pseudozyma flocculosa PF-1]EPQ32243.1 hypothetical protein PFL1_00440 [Pseudozyma flocculosa PF-1]SPO34807.1 uncharacterized protein PSFLO_00278 [Pseudozyma flocculosa]
MLRSPCVSVLRRTPRLVPPLPVRPASSLTATITDTSVSHDRQDSAAAKCPEPSAQNHKRPKDSSRRRRHEAHQRHAAWLAERPTLQSVTIKLAAQQQIQPARSLEQLFDRWDHERLQSESASHTPGQSQEEILLRRKLHEHNLSEADWMSMLNAVSAATWPEVRSCMYAFPTEDWPSFVLHHGIRAVSTPSEASDALAVILCRVSTAKPKRMVAIFSLFARKVLYEMPALHLCSRLTDLFLDMAASQPQGEAYPPQFLDETCVLLARHLARHDDQRARDAAMRLLDWSESRKKGAPLQQQLCAIFLRIDRTPPEFLGARGVSLGLAEARRLDEIDAFRSSRFLTTELAERLLQRLPRASGGALRRRALRNAILAAGRDHYHAMARRWFDDLCLDSKRQGRPIRRDPGHELVDSRGSLWDLEIYMRAMARAQRDDDRTAANALNQLQLLLETKDETGNLTVAGKRTWDTMVVFVSSDERAPLERTLAMLGIQLQADETPDSPTGQRTRRPDIEVINMLDASMKIINQFGRKQRSYTLVMDGLMRRKQYTGVLAVWQAMLRRQVKPSPASMTILLQALFALGQPAKALEQMRQWCEQGVDMTAVTPVIGAPLVLSRASLESPVEGLLHVPALPSNLEAGGEAVQLERKRVSPDLMMATALFEGLYRARLTDATFSIWTLIRKTLGVAPDAPILAILLKSACGCSDVSIPAPTPEAPAKLTPPVAKLIFCKVLLLQHAELKDCSIRPMLRGRGADLLGAGASWILRSELGMRTMERWVSDRVLRLVGAKGAARGADPSIPNTSLQRRPDGGDATEQIDFTVTFSPELFDHYLRLLLYIQLQPARGLFGGGGGAEDGERGGRVESEGHIEELLLILSWMRTLEVTPLRRTIASICLELEEALPPLSLSSSASSASSPSSSGSDEGTQPGKPGASSPSFDSAQHVPADLRPLRENAGLLADWLREWRGEEAWPTDREMRTAYKWKMQRTRAAERGGGTEWEERRRWFSFRPTLEDEARWHRERREREDDFFTGRA